MKTPLEDEIDDILRKAYRGKSSDTSVPNKDFIEKMIKKAASAPLTEEEILNTATLLDLDPDKLLKVAEQPYYKQPKQPDNWQTLVHPFGHYTVNSHVLVNHNRTQCIVFDTGTREDEIETYLKEENLDLHQILITHGHRDHIGGLNQLVDKYPHTQVHAYDNSLHTKAKRIREGDEFTFDTFRIETLHTPGHARDSICFKISTTNSSMPPVLVVGDALFARSVGKIPNNYKRSLQIIEEKLLNQQADTIVLPGHGGNTTIKSERKKNPFFNIR